MPSRKTPPAQSAEPAAPPRGCTSFKLRQLTRRVSQHYDQIIGTAGLKTTQYSLLSTLARLGSVRPGELARFMEMDASTLTRNLQPLVLAGWLVVGAGQDSRSRLVTLTAAGQAKRAQAQRAWKQAQLSLNGRLGVQQVTELHALIDECLLRMNETPGEQDA